MKAEQIGAGAAAVGLLFVVAALVWPSVTSGRSSWTDADAEAYQETVSRAHVGAHLEARQQSRATMHGGEPIDPERLLQHREDMKSLKALKAKLDAARERPFRIAGILKWSGAGLVVVGVAVLVVSRSRAG